MIGVGLCTEVRALKEAEVVTIRSSRAKVSDTLTANEADRLAGFLTKSAKEIRMATIEHAIKEMR